MNSADTSFFKCLILEENNSSNSLLGRIAFVAVSHSLTEHKHPRHPEHLKTETWGVSRDGGAAAPPDHKAGFAVCKLRLQLNLPAIPDGSSDWDLRGGMSWSTALLASNPHPVINNSKS